MLRRIATTDLRVGMYIEDFCGSWMDHPFWRAHFTVSNEAQLAQITASGVRELWIDASRGCDVDAGTGVPARPSAAEAAVDSRLDSLAGEPDAAAQPRAADMGSELERAARIFHESRRNVAQMFSEARLGGLRDTTMVEGVVDDIAASVARHPGAMIGLSRLKRADDYTFMHSMAVSALMVALARTLGLDEEQSRNAGMAGLLHDVGKAQIPLEILNKPGSLDEKEWNTMRMHAERGHALLQDARGVTPGALEAVLHHHEKIDGTGYPHRLKGAQIPELARMTAVCDVYDAVTSDRPYKAGWQPTVAIRRMTEWTTHFDDRIFKALVKTVGIYPVGSLVRLKSQRLAVVIDHDPAHLLQPTVKIFFSLRSKMHVVPTILKLGKSGDTDRIVGYEDPAEHGLTRLNELWLPPGAAPAGQ